MSISANAFLAGGKIIIGYASNSSAVLAEGFHSLTDIFSSLIGYLGIRTSNKPVDEKHPYGHYKFEVLSGVFITLVLLATGIGVLYDAYLNFLNPYKIKINYLSFSIMAVSVVINFITSKIKIYYGKKENSLTLLSDGSHDKADVLASAAVILGLFLTRYYVYADSLIAFFIGLYIIKSSFSLGKEAVDSLLDVSAGKEIEENIKAISKGLNVEIYSLKTQKKGSVITANLEITLPNDLNVEQASKISENLRTKLTEGISNLVYVAIQIKSYKIESGFYRPSFGRSFGWQGGGRHKETIEKASGSGPSGSCVCPKCGYKILHQRGIPCSSLVCPNCNINLERKENFSA